MTLYWNRATQSIDKGDASALPDYPIEIWEFDEQGFLVWCGGGFDDFLEAVKILSDYHGKYAWRNQSKGGPHLGTLDIGPSGVEITINDTGATQ